MLPGWEKPEMGCIMPVGGAPLAMGCGRGGGPDETSGGDTPTGRGGRGSGGTPERGAVMEAKGGMPGRQIYSTDNIRYMNKVSVKRRTRHERETS